MGILTNKFFKVVEPYFLIRYRKHDGHWIELRPMPPKVEALALKFTMPCVCKKCERQMHPFRLRVSKSKRGKPGKMYYAPTCPTDVNKGCSKGHDATAEYDDIAEYFQKHPNS